MVQASLWKTMTTEVVGRRLAYTWQEQEKQEKRRRKLSSGKENGREGGEGDEAKERQGGDKEEW